MIYDTQQDAENAICDFMDRKIKEGFFVRVLKFNDDAFFVYHFKDGDGKAPYATATKFAFKKETK